MITSRDIFCELHLPKDYNGDLGIWYKTFSEHNDCTYLTIYGYDECPIWFTDTWWNKAEWKLN
jgi:hypothetical protein